MADTYFKVDDGLPEHRKVVAAGGDAGWLHVCGMAYASRNRTDGFIPKGVVPRLSDRRQPDKLAARLCEATLWHAAGHECKRCPQPSQDEYVIHDYLGGGPIHQRSAEKIAEVKSKRAAAGRAGGTKKAANARSGAKARGKQSSSNLLDGGQGSAQAKPTPDTDTEEVLRTSRADTDTPPAGADDGAHDVSTKTILGEYIDRCRKRPPDRVLGQLGKEIKTMLGEGVEPNDIRKGIAQWMTRDVHPSVLPSIVNNVMNGRPPAAGGSGARSRTLTAEEINQMDLDGKV